MAYKLRENVQTIELPRLLVFLITRQKQSRQVILLRK